MSVWLWPHLGFVQMWENSVCILQTNVGYQHIPYIQSKVIILLKESIILSWLSVVSR